MAENQENYLRCSASGSSRSQAHAQVDLQLHVSYLGIAGCFVQNFVALRATSAFLHAFLEHQNGGEGAASEKEVGLSHQISNSWMVMSADRWARKGGKA